MHKFVLQFIDNQESVLNFELFIEIDDIVIVFRVMELLCFLLGNVVYRLRYYGMD